MPHFVVKLWPGKPEQQKTRFAQEITDSVTPVLNYGAESVSVGFEEVESQDWAEKVYPQYQSQVGPAPQETGIQPARKVRNSL